MLSLAAFSYGSNQYDEMSDHEISGRSIQPILSKRCPEHEKSSVVSKFMQNLVQIALTFCVHFNVASHFQYNFLNLLRILS